MGKCEIFLTLHQMVNIATIVLEWFNPLYHALKHTEWSGNHM